MDEKVEMPETPNADKPYEPKPERSRLRQLLEDRALKEDLEKALKSAKTTEEG